VLLQFMEQTTKELHFLHMFDHKMLSLTLVSEANDWLVLNAMHLPHLDKNETPDRSSAEQDESSHQEKTGSAGSADEVELCCVGIRQLTQASHFRNGDEKIDIDSVKSLLLVNISGSGNMVVF
jgi:hypothetical protein